MTDPLFTVWATTEGLDYAPILCTTGDLATDLVTDLTAARIISEGAIVPCCRNDPDAACIRDTWDPRELDRPIELLMRAAMARNLTWPADLGHTEPEYPVLSDE